MKKKILETVLLLLCFTGVARSMTTEERRDYLRWMQQTLPDVPAWNDWQTRTGELPPDFDALPKNNGLPDAMRFLDGRPVKTDADWVARQAEIRQLFEKYVVGSFPAKPKIENVVALDEVRGKGFVTRNVRLEFGPDRKGSVRVQITMPEGGGKFPVLICPNLAGWGPALIRRGYISVGYAGNDAMDDGEKLKDLYPENDFATLPRRAWLVHVVLDYLETLQEVDMKRIALFGYSRDGKMAAIAAAFDERIAALVAGSTGVGGFVPWRLAGERGGGEGIETTTRMFPTWMVPRLRFFAGREDRLPVDANLFLALLAPRAVLIEWGLNDQVSNGWAIEQAMHAAQPIYDRLGQSNRLGVLRVPGFHGSNDQEACIDWLDIQFGRSDRIWKNDFLFPWDYNTWLARTGEKIDLNKFPAQTVAKAYASKAEWEQTAPALRKSVEWMLGDEPPLLPTTGRFVPPARPGAGQPPAGPTEVAKGNIGNPGQLAPDVPAWVIKSGGVEYGWLDPEKNHVESRKLRFGYGLTGDFYYPTNTPAGTKLPTVIWLHGFHYPLGYMWVYRRDLHPILALVKAGYTVLAYDQSGFGSRTSETAPFYERYPHWSQLGRMVEDVRGAVDALLEDKLVDAQHISVFGYTLGGTVGLYAAALDSRIKGVVSISGFTPMRTDTPDRGTSGLIRYSHQRGLMPRVGLFAGHEGQLPYDFDDVISLVAPRPVLVVQPQMDREATPKDVHAAVDQARKVYSLYDAGTKLGLDEPQDYARLPTATQDRIIEWMRMNF